MKNIALTKSSKAWKDWIQRLLNLWLCKLINCYGETFIIFFLLTETKEREMKNSLRSEVQKSD